jgi:hypothetical protein
MWEQIQTGRRPQVKATTRPILPWQRLPQPQWPLLPSVILLLLLPRPGVGDRDVRLRRAPHRSSADVLADALVVSQQAGPPDCPKTFSDGLCVCVLKFLHPSVAFDHAFFAGLPKAVGEILTVPEIARVRAHFCDGDLGEAYRVLMTNGLDGRTKKLQTALLAYIAKQLRSKAENAAIKKAKDEAAELKQSRKREREEEEKKVQEDTEDEIECVSYRGCPFKFAPTFFKRIRSDSNFAQTAKNESNLIRKFAQTAKNESNLIRNLAKTAKNESNLII